MLASGVSTTLMMRGGRVRIGTSFVLPVVPTGLGLDAGRDAAPADAPGRLSVITEGPGGRGPAADDARPRPLVRTTTGEREGRPFLLARSDAHCDFGIADPLVGMPGAVDAGVSLMASSPTSHSRWTMSAFDAH
jgi:hypothetical protein